MSNPTEIRVVVADDFPALRRGVIGLIEREPGVVIVGEAGDAASVMEVVGRTAPHVVLLDLGMPGVRGLELVRALRAQHPRSAVLVFTMHREEDLALPCLKAGASGFINKTSSEAELRLAVRTAAEGRRYLSAAMAERLVDGAPLPVQTPPHHALSERELDVLCRIARGAKPADMAATLGISVKTVHTYRARILEKLGARSNVDLVLYAVEHRLLGWPPHDALRPRPSPSDRGA